MSSFVDIAIVAIAIMITILVAILVTVLALSTFGTIEYDCEVTVLIVLVFALKLWQHAALEETGTDYEEGAIDLLLYDSGIGHDVGWRTVDDDIVVLLSKLLNQMVEAWIEEEFGWVWRNGSCRDDA